MSYKIEEIEGIGSARAEQLAIAGIATVEILMEKAASKAGRKEVAEASGISESQILSYVNMGDLMRINGVGGEFAELMVASGVDTIKELRNRNAANLHAKMLEVNEEKSLTRRVPSEEEIQKFIDAAGELDPMVTH